jgi:hypothetical protein
MATVDHQQLERRVRALTMDTRQSDYVSDPDVVGFALDRALGATFSRLSTPPTLVAALLTLVANDYDYALSAAYSDIDAFNGFRLVSTGRPIEKVDLPTWQLYRTGNPIDTGDPKVIAFSEGTAGVETAYLWPTPWQADTVEGLVSVGYGAGNPDFNASGAEMWDSASVSYQFPGQSQRAVVYHAAAELIAGMGDEKIAKLGLNAGVAKLYMDQYEKTVQDELAREARLRRSDLIVERNAF